MRSSINGVKVGFILSIIVNELPMVGNNPVGRHPESSGHQRAELQSSKSFDSFQKKKTQRCKNRKTAFKLL